jgi:MFS family permease
MVETPIGIEHGRKRWIILGLLALAELLGMSLWFTASAVSPRLKELWGLTSAETAWLTTVVQLGFVAGTAVAATLNLADIIPSKLYFAGAAVLAAGSNCLIAIAPRYALALGMRFLTGFFLAGVYPPVMKMAATWFRAGRGLAIGVIVGALTVGKASPYLLRAFSHHWESILLATSSAAVAAALVVALGYREGPHRFERRSFSWGLIPTLARSRPTTLAIGGYLGHMWELYGMWTWMPAFVAASCKNLEISELAVDAISFGTIAAGGLGCVWGGWEADRLGRARLVNICMAWSGACALLIGLLFGSSPWLLAPLAWTWGFFVVADSAQFSAMVTETAPAHTVGTALTLQTSLGFLLSMVTIQGVPLVADAIGWPWAFCGLAVGPLFGIISIRKMH